MTKETKWKLRFQNYEKAFHKLSNIVQKEQLGELEKMALIQAFEYTFELGWKTMKDYLDEHGFNVKSPKDTIRQAYQSEYIKNGQVWMDAFEKRNESSHAYEEAILQATTDFILNVFFVSAESFYNDFKIRMAEE